MKKIICSILALIFCITPALFLSGCGDKKDFWIETSEKIVSFEQNENYSFILQVPNGETEEYGIYSGFNNQIKIATLVSPKYKDLKHTYNKLLEQSLRPYNDYKSSFGNTPTYLTDKNKKQIKNYYTDFNESLQSFENECISFTSAYNHFNQNVTSDLDGTFATQKLNEFKNSFYNLILKALDLSTHSLNLYTNCYQNLGYTKTDDETVNVPAGNEKLANNVILINFINCYLQVEFAPYNGVCMEEKQFPEFSNFVNIAYLNKDKSPNGNLENYVLWHNQYEFMKNEFEVFLNSLNNFSVSEYVKNYNKNTTNFLNENPESEIYFNIFENAKNTVFVNIITTTNNIFA